MPDLRTTHQECIIKLEKATLKGFLDIPPMAKGIVIFAHGSGSGRHSPRNQMIAKFLYDQNIATLLLDMLTLEEEQIDNRTREYRFNIPFLATRLEEVTRWIEKDKKTEAFSIGYFGASTGAAAALIAAADLGEHIKAVVSRGGRPDLAASHLSRVVAPTLLLVGGNDFGVIELNQKAFDLLTGVKKMEIIPGATHLFEEEGALEQVGSMAAHWFLNYL